MPRKVRRSSSTPMRWTLKFLFLSLLFCRPVDASEITIFDVRQNIPMHNDEKVFRDYYINGGEEVGIKEGLVITVTRRKTLYDAYQNRSPGDIQVPVGKLKIIHAQKGVSVARLLSVYSRKNLPSLDLPGIMVGDKLDMKTARMAKRKPNTVKRRASAPKPEPEPTVITGAAIFPAPAPSQDSPAKSEKPDPTPVNALQP